MLHPIAEILEFRVQGRFAFVLDFTSDRLQVTIQGLGTLCFCSGFRSQLPIDYNSGSNGALLLLWISHPIF